MPFLIIYCKGGCIIICSSLGGWKNARGERPRGRVVPRFCLN